MTEPAIVMEPGRPTRPGTVVWAAVCFWLAAALVLAQLGQVLYDLATIGDLTRRAGQAAGASHSDVASEIGTAHTFDAVTLGVILALAAGLVLGSVGFIRGSHRARILALVTAGAVLLCCTGTVASGLTNVAVDATTLQRTVTDLVLLNTPAWVGWLTTAALAVYPLLIAGSTLLLVPASNRYFRPYAGYFAVPVVNL